VPNSVLCLVGFVGEWQVGGYVALVATAAYLVAAWLVWAAAQSLDAGAGTRASNAESP